MDQEIHFIDKPFDFSKITISQPVAVQGGAYFTKIKYDNKPLYIQTIKCITKQGLNETSKKAYIDLMYTVKNMKSTLLLLLESDRVLQLRDGGRKDL